MRAGLLTTSRARTYALDDVGPAVMAAEATGRKGKILPGPGHR